MPGAALCSRRADLTGKSLPPSTTGSFSVAEGAPLYLHRFPLRRRGL